MMDDKSVWNSLEITKIITGALGAIAVVWLTFQLQGVGESSKRIQGRQTEIYEKIGPMLNSLISYYYFVGKWKEKRVSDIISVKRELDEYVFSNQLYFSRDFFTKYKSLMDVFFDTGQGWRVDAKLNTKTDNRKPDDGMNEDDFKKHFTQVDRRKDICKHYGELLAQMAVDLGIGTRNKADCPPEYN
jgi:hypothetical protein